MYEIILAQASIETTLVQESSVNKYTLDLPFFYVHAIRLPFYKRVGAIHYKLCNAASEGSFGSKQLQFSAFCKMSINTIFL
jgi:hypothetical protein